LKPIDDLIADLNRFLCTPQSHGLFDKLSRFALPGFLGGGLLGGLLLCLELLFDPSGDLQPALLP
jgi:hypothetical protein